MYTCTQQNIQATVGFRLQIKNSEIIVHNDSMKWLVKSKISFVKTLIWKWLDFYDLKPPSKHVKFQTRNKSNANSCQSLSVLTSKLKVLQADDDEDPSDYNTDNAVAVVIAIPWPFFLALIPSTKSQQATKVVYNFYGYRETGRVKVWLRVVRFHLNF